METPSRYATICLSLVIFILQANAFIVESYAGVPIKTSIVISILDSETRAFVGQPAYLKVLSYDNRTFTYTITHSPQVIEFFVIPIPEEIRDVKLPYYFTAYREGYKESETFVYDVTWETPKEGIIFNHTFYLEALTPTRVYVNVKNIIEQPIKDANITVTAIYANESFSGRTDENGIFSFTTRFENFKIYVSAEGYKPYKGELKVLHNVTEMSYNVVLDYISTARMTIEVKDEAWNFIDGAKVTFTSDCGSFSKIAEKGIAKFEVPTTKHTLRVEKEGYQLYEETLDLSKPVVGVKVIQLVKIPLPWWQQYWYVIVGILIICITVPLLLKVKRRI